MENTLLPGDFIIVNEIAYNISTPKEVPLVGLRIPYTKIIDTGKPGLKDLVVFEFPSGFTVDSSLNNSKFIKRVIAGPGDTLQIIDKEFYVNGELLKLPNTIKILEKTLRRGWVKEDGIYPPGEKWNRDNYGPIVVPSNGDTIKITPKNFERWQSVIVMDYGERALLLEGSVITLSGKPITEYVTTQDHYFVIGDNIDVSLDSRYFGFITDNMIIGKAMFIYWSINPEKSAPGPLGFLSAIRSNRIFKSVK